MHKYWASSLKQGLIDLFLCMTCTSLHTTCGSGAGAKAKDHPSAMDHEAMPHGPFSSAGHWLVTTARPASSTTAHTRVLWPLSTSCFPTRP